MTRHEQIIQTVKQINPKAIMWDGLDEAIIGYGGAFDQCVLIYLRPTILRLLMQKSRGF